MKHQFKMAAMALALGLCFATRAGAQNSAQDFSDSGDAKEEKGDLEGALADYNHAIELDPKNAAAFLGRGSVKQDKGDNDGALADYNKALELDPANAGAYMNRGEVKEYKGDADGAIADYTAGIKLNPNDFPGYSARGAVRLSKGDTDGAAADFDHAVEVDPKNPLVYMFRGGEKFRLGKWADALADFRHCCELPRDDDSALYQDFTQAYIWVTRAQMGEADAATKELAAGLAAHKTDAPDWFSKVAGYLTGTVTEADLMTAAAAAYKMPDPDQACEAWFYVGMKKLASGDKKGAIEALNKCLATQRRAAGEYQMAGSVLKTLAP